MTGILLIDKPSGPTSHDVVARVRNTARERSVGHTGTLDPMATGLLPLVMGKATRLAPYLAGSDKTYDAAITLGVETDTEDANGSVVDTFSGAMPTEGAIRAALAAFSGEFDQVPPKVSAKRVDGHKSYDLVRAEKDFELEPVRVTVRQLEMHGATSDPGADGRARVTVTLTVTATAGFYVRALARDLGRALGTGAHLSGLRRTKSGHFDIARAVPLAEAERLGPDVAAYVISPADALAHFPAVTLNDLGFKRATHGNACGPAHLAGRFVPVTSGDEKVRLLDPAGHLVALANSRGGELHPAVVIADR